ncbi:MAG TPA: isoaspartyl peptidase/L-asparaginase [Steroidobacteraceae bacterium]|nr:isoaspartyl peptidase/L-asparaginase [Steroidobacteraceae bacterium]
MRSQLSVLAGLCLLAAWSVASGEKLMFGIAIHGGAGTMPRAEITPELEAQYRADLAQALDTGYGVLEKGGTSQDAAIAAVKILEDSPLFNAGKGAVFNRDGEVELDAGVMDGASRRAGSVAGLKHVKNPIELARLVMDKSPHVMLIGPGAEEFALDQGMTLVPNSYFHTEKRREQLERALKGDRMAAIKLNYFGTVGAVTRDKQGNLFAATSTGGMTGKIPGRVGDSPHIGAGTYANNETCAVSATGHGEFFIRSVVAYDIHALMDYKEMSLDKAVNEVVQRKLKVMKAEGGVIAIDSDGHIVMSFNTEGMFRGARDSAGRREIAIY